MVDGAKKRATAHEPKCGHCRGWGIEPDENPMKICGECNGTGKPAPAEPPAATGDLVDG